MAKKEPRGTREMNSGKSQDRNRGNNGGNRGNERESMSAGSRSGQSRTGAEWREMDRKQTGGRGMDTRHAGRGRDQNESSHDMSRYNMTENERGSSRESG